MFMTKIAHKEKPDEKEGSSLWNAGLDGILIFNNLTLPLEVILHIWICQVQNLYHFFVQSFTGDKMNVLVVPPCH